MKSLKNRFEESNAVPLLPEDKEQLVMMYNSRRRLFIRVYFVLIPLAFFCSLRTGYQERYSGRVKTWTTFDKSGLSDVQMICVNNVFLTFPVLLSGLIIYRKRISGLKKDINSGVKYAVYEEVVFRQYFPVTSQYFLSLKDPDYMHHEVDAATYNAVRQGELFAVYFARHSMYAFNKNGSFQII